MVAVVAGVGVGLDHNNIVLSIESISRTAPVGQNLPNETFTLRNSDVGLMNYTITDNAAWISVSPSSGSSSGETDTLTVQYNTTLLLPGQYTATITVTSAEAENSPRTIPVQLTVQPPPRAPVDFDKDGDVDQADFGAFQACYSGQGIPQTRPECAGALLDDGQDVDQDDFLIFLECYSGPNVPADPNCAD
jgi:hypothetical protein